MFTLTNFNKMKMVFIFLFYIISIFIMAIILFLILDISDDGIRFAGEYKTYYWSDVFTYIKSLF